MSRPGSRRLVSERVAEEDVDLIYSGDRDE